MKMFKCIECGGMAAADFSKCPVCGAFGSCLDTFRIDIEDDYLNAHCHIMMGTEQNVIAVRAWDDSGHSVEVDIEQLEEKLWERKGWDI